MSIFKDITVSWSGKNYKIEAGKVMGLVDTVEDIITIEELADGKVRRAKMAKAFAAIIEYAGGYVEIEQVYNRFFDPTHAEELSGVINSILQLMIPPQHLQGDSGEPEEAKKQIKPDGD